MEAVVPDVPEYPGVLAELGGPFGPDEPEGRDEPGEPGEPDEPEGRDVEGAGSAMTSEKTSQSPPTSQTANQAFSKVSRFAVSA